MTVSDMIILAAAQPVMQLQYSTLAGLQFAADSRQLLTARQRLAVFYSIGVGCSLRAVCSKQSRMLLVQSVCWHHLLVTEVQDWLLTCVCCCCCCCFIQGELALMPTTTRVLAGVTPSELKRLQQLRLPQHWQKRVPAWQPVPLRMHPVRVSAWYILS
jgi:hypothetical protein